MTRIAQQSWMADCVPGSEFRRPGCSHPNLVFPAFLFFTPITSFSQKAISRVASAQELSFPSLFRTSSPRAPQLVRNEGPASLVLDGFRAALQSFRGLSAPHGCRLGELSVWGKWLSMNFLCRSGRAWSHASAEIWTPSHFSMANRWAPRLFEKQSRLI